jgi:hypothetical protein
MLGVLSLLFLPFRVARALLVSPRTARRHPLSQQLRSLLDDGWEVTRHDVDLEPLWVSVDLERDGDRRELRSGELAFAAYSLQAVPRARVRAARERIRDLSALP